MKLTLAGLFQAVLIGCAFLPAGALACNPELNGCLGCNDNELPACLRAFVEEICDSSGNQSDCDTQRAYDDAERRVMISTGNHMSKVRSMVRSSRKYQLH
ncbi:MAG: hypothetical protein WBO34_01980 [Gammaproteobacteria bacterium]